MKPTTKYLSNGIQLIIEINLKHYMKCLIKMKALEKWMNTDFLWLTYSSYNFLK